MCIPGVRGPRRGVALGVAMAFFVTVCACRSSSIPGARTDGGSDTSPRGSGGVAGTRGTSGTGGGSGVATNESGGRSGSGGAAGVGGFVCTTEECGPAPQTSFTVNCTDASVAGPLCSRYPSGKCAWSLPSCQDATGAGCTGEACGPTPPPDFCKGLGNYGVCVTDGTSGCNWRVTCSDLPPIDAAAE
jgi:hypothetical protein